MTDWATPGDRHTFIQWKNTNLCMDFTCPECAITEHYDGMFMHYIRCGNCRAEFELGTWIDIP